MNDEYYSMEMGKDYLAHHGVKGMKWGIRHDPERVGRAKKKVKSLASTIARGFKKAAKGTYKVGKRGAKLAKKAKYKTKQYQIERAIASGKTQKINRLFSQMNDQQAARAITRMNQRQQIKNAKIQDISRSPRNTALQKKINNLNLQRQYTQAKHPILTRERDKAIDNVVNKASNEAANVAIKKVEKIMKMEVDSKSFDKEKFANDLKEEIVDSLKESDMVESGKDYLSHHGVKGMKWGIRHNEDRISSLNQKKSKVEAKLQKALSKRAKFKNTRKALRADKAEIKLAKRKSIGFFKSRALTKAKKLDFKVDKFQRKVNKLDKKISDIQNQKDLQNRLVKGYSQVKSFLKKNAKSMRSATNSRAYEYGQREMYRMQQEEIMRQSIDEIQRASNLATSLSISGGTNPGLVGPI